MAVMGWVNPRTSWCGGYGSTGLGSTVLRSTYFVGLPWGGCTPTLCIFIVSSSMLMPGTGSLSLKCSSLGGNWLKSSISLELPSGRLLSVGTGEGVGLREGVLTSFPSLSG